MVWVNYIHRNHKVPPGTYGGAICMCAECCKNRQTPEAKDAIEVMQGAQLLSVMGGEMWVTTKKDGE